MSELPPILCNEVDFARRCVRNAPEFVSKLNRGIEMASSLRLTTLAAGPMARKKGEVGFFM